jgi:hypothetical protein
MVEYVGFSGNKGLIDSFGAREKPHQAGAFQSREKNPAGWQNGMTA